MPSRHVPPTVCLLGAALACAPASDARSTADAPAAESLGHVDFGVRCASAVRDDFDRAVALLHHMTYPVADSIFEAVAEADPDCAMAYWGQAMTLFQPLWPTRPGEPELARGRALVQKAESLDPGSARDGMFVAAAAAFFDSASSPDYWARIQRWADAQTALYEAFPEDVEAQAFYALAELATESLSGTPAEHHARAAEVLGQILAAEPTHPGAVHYTIHADDFDGREHESLSVVGAYADIAPRNPHALHMPTHIFVRLGDWDQVIAWNERAAEAALAQRVGPEGEYVWDEYPHAVEYLTYAHLQRADDRRARELIDALHGTSALQPSFKTAFHLASTSARYAIERRDWEMAARLEARTPEYLPWDSFWWPEAVTWYARGLGAVHLGDPASGTASLRRLNELEGRARAAGEPYFATQIHVLELEVAAWAAVAAGDRERAIASMGEAVELEEATPKHPVTPGATVPAREMLGDLYFELRAYEDARREYVSVSERTPARFNTLLGLARTAVALADSAEAERRYRSLIDLAVDGSEREGAQEAASYLRLTR